MKLIFVTTAVLVAGSMLIAPAAAASRKHKGVAAPAPQIATKRPIPSIGRHAHEVYTSDGELVGRDPDPFIRLMIQRDPRPWLYSE
jgi:hypothetical protein